MNINDPDCEKTDRSAFGLVLVASIVSGRAFHLALVIVTLSAGAAQTGDLQSLLDILAPDVVLLGDGGGVKQAVLRPIVGAKKVASVLSAGLGTIATASLQLVQVNGYPALTLRFNSEIDTVIAVRIDNGLITGLYAVRNPEKLSHMQRETALRR